VERIGSSETDRPPSVKMLKKDESNPADSASRLPQMAKHLEVSLYRNARSFEAYTDKRTLKQRLHAIAAEVSKKATNRDDQSQRHFQNQGSGGANVSPYMGGMSNRGGRMMSMEEGTPMSTNGSNTNNNGQYRQDLSSRGSRAQQHQQNRSQRGNSSEYDQRVRHKQQRLLLLHHSAKCMQEGQCTVTPHCADMKKLWRHMEGCKDNSCRVPHCFSSRAILSHFRKCKDPRCPACIPVREAVRKNQGSSSTQAASTGSLMNSMRSSAPPQQMVTPSDSMTQMSGSSFGSNSVGQQRSSPHNGMPPPSGTAAGSNGDMQFSSQYRPMNGSSSTSNVQPLFGSDKQEPEQRSSSGPRDTLSASLSSGSRPAGSSESEWQKIRHKQQRLLLLRHASKCQHTDGTCPVTPHCASMKKLWEHIANCKDQQCKVQHCLSSRYVLSHYRRCKNKRCLSCQPVRDSIRRNAAGERPSGASRTQDAQRHRSSGIDGLVEDPTGPLQSPERKKIKLEGNQSVTSGSTTVVVSNKSSKPASNRVSQSSAPKSSHPADPSLLNCLSLNNLETHLASLDRKTQLPPTKLKSKCTEVLKGLQNHPHGWVFNCPVDPVELGLPDYFEVIKKPMDLGTIQKKLENGGYHSIKEFEDMVHLTFDNAMTYNDNGSVVYGMAKELKTKFVSDMRKLMSQLEGEDMERRQNERACTLCGCEKLLFEPPVYFCNGINCPSQRIRRNNNFYIGGKNQYYWCSSCFNELDDNIPIELADMTIMKNQLRKKRNDEVHEESWVQCDTCERWVHQICGLFNTRQNKEHHSEYCCPKCLRDKRVADPGGSLPKSPGAADLPRTTLSEWLEKHIAKRVERKKREIAAEKAQRGVRPLHDTIQSCFSRICKQNSTMEEANKELFEGGDIIIRQVTSMERKHEVRELMQKRYAHKNYPEEFPFRCKCIVVFQRLDGVDVVLFALYLYEHGENNPPPNQRVVYISYLDSVHFMRPRRLRTFVYHEILIAYLDYARRRGYSTAHIWACPPLKGDDYIFFAKPEDQKTPRDNRLRQWYIDMLVECQKRSIVGKVTNMYDLYFANLNLDATAVPYLEGDYFPGEAENIIKMLQDGKGKKNGKGSNKKKNKATAKNKGNTGTRSTGVDEEALLASGILDEAKTFKDLDRDQVMVKLGETIQPMKESFIVAFLNWSGAREEDLVVPDDIEKARIEYAANSEPDLVGSKRDAMGNSKDTAMPQDSNGNEVKVIDDDAEDLDCEFLNNRQAFLNLCRGNHYQFDELRRAKHTSMMVLWHLHNRDAPKFVQQCVGCSREILSGKRYHCNTCPDYDLCQDCYKDPNANRGACTHKLQPIAVEPNGGQERSGLSDAERAQRQRNLMMHIQLIEHASGCVSKSCSSSNCARMKRYLKHASTCSVKVQGGCKICKRIWTLLRIHAQKCKKPKCPIPQCTLIREKMRQLQKQQQAMDDRRRLEMNRHMRFSMAGSAGH